MSSPQNKPAPSSLMNSVFVFFLAGAVLFAAFSGEMKAVTEASVDSAKSAVNLAISLIGVMALWLGLVRILEAGGLMYSLAKALRPLMTKLFPDVPAEHPAMGAMILNISANMLGLGNAATPFGIKAMIELNRLNPLPGTATNAMCLFLAINTSSIALFPLGVINVRAAAGSLDPAGIWLPTSIATLVSTIVAIVVATFFAARDRAYASTLADKPKIATTEVDLASEEPVVADYQALRSEPTAMAKVIAWSMAVLFLLAIALTIFGIGPGAEKAKLDGLSQWLLPGLMLAILAYGVARGVKIYDAVTEGAKQGFELAVRIIPFLVAILVAVGMFRASGAMELLVQGLSPVTELLGMPADTLPMALVRPLSGSGAFGIMGDMLRVGPDSYSAYLSCVMMGSTETTFYVLAVYFGAAGIYRVRHALVAALLADLAGILTSCLVAPMFFKSF